MFNWHHKLIVYSITWVNVNWLANEFQTFDLAMMLQKLSILGFTSSAQSAVQWFNTYLSDRMQSIKVDKLMIRYHSGMGYLKGQ